MIVGSCPTYVRLGVLALAVAAAAPHAIEAEVGHDDQHVRVVYLMGTRATLVTYDADRHRAARRLERLLEVLESTEAELSTWRADSAVTRLNAATPGRPYSLSPSLCSLFGALDDWTRESSGAFDAAIGAVSAAWGLHSEPRVPSAEEARTARQQSGWHHLRFNASSCSVTPDAGVAIDVGGFGKGEALDRAAQRLADDLQPWMIDLGGQVLVHGAPPDAQDWTVDLAHPHHRERSVASLVWASGSIATSGGSERDAHVDGQRVGHILDPRTGEPARFGGSVVVWHESALVADILSTALYVMGPAEGTRWAEERGIAACFLTAEHGDVRFLSTRRFRARPGDLSLLRNGAPDSKSRADASASR